MKLLFKAIPVFLFFSFTRLNNPVGVITYDQFQSLAEKKTDDTLYVVNFWATWCKPCVAEMPAFIEAGKKFAQQKVKVIFVSLNAVKELSKVESFVNTKNIQNPVYLLNAGNPNDWIDKIEPSWGGSIPATIMYKKGKKVFFKEGDFTPEELEKAITNHYNP